MHLPPSLFIEDPDGRRRSIALVYALVGVPFIAWLWLLGESLPAVLAGSLVPVSAVVFLLMVRTRTPWVWVYPLGAAPLLSCLAGAEASGQPGLFLALLMGPAGISGLHDNRRSVIGSWAFCAVGFLILAHRENGGPWGYGAATIAAVMHLTISLVVFFKAEQHREALAAATKATAEVQAALSVAKDAIMTRERFLANMTHELRTPLSGIIGMGQLVPLHSEPGVKEIVDTIVTSATSLLEIVNDVLVFSKGHSGTLELRKAPFVPAVVIREAVRSIASQAYERKLELLLELAPNLPDSMVGDELRFRQVVINLVGNALKFTPVGSVLVKASLKGAPRSLCFEVVDTGIGIPKERLSGIFDAFVQVDSSDARRFGGTGLGLTIAAQLVGLMGGALEVESRLGVGSTFRFCLPLEGASARGPLVSRDAWLQGRRVALIPGRSAARGFLRGMLENTGASTVESDRLELLALLLQRARDEGHPFDLAVVDLSAEGQWADVVNAAQSIPVLALLTPEQRATHRAPACTGVTVIEKPYCAQDLRAAVSSLRLPTQARTSHPEPGLGRPLDALVVEDNSVNARVAVGLLTRLGHRSVVAVNGVEALRALANRHFDVVLMDMQMPEMDGVEATARIRSGEAGTQAHLPIVMVSANNLPEHKAASLNAGADAHLGKPLKLKDLEEMLARLPTPRNQPNSMQPPTGTHDGIDPTGRASPP